MKDASSKTGFGEPALLIYMEDPRLNVWHLLAIPCYTWFGYKQGQMQILK
jgi:hypothetical protein